MKTFYCWRHTIGWADLVAAKWELRLMESLDVASLAGQFVAVDHFMLDVVEGYGLLDEQDLEGNEFLEEAKKVQHSHQSRHRGPQR